MSVKSIEPHERIQRHLNDLQTEVFDCVVNGIRTLDDISIALNRRRSSVSGRLSELSDMGVVYIVKSKGDQSTYFKTPRRLVQHYKTIRKKERFQIKTISYVQKYGEFLPPRVQNLLSELV